MTLYTYRKSAANLAGSIYFSFDSGENVNQLKITQIKSSNGRLVRHKACLKGLGLRGIRHTVVCQNTPSVRGMINTIYYMVSVEKL